MSNLKYLPVSESCALQMLNSATVFEEYLRTERTAAKVRGGMYWKKQGKYEYLVRTTPQNQQTRIGARTLETEQICTDFFSRKAAAEQRLRAIGEALVEAQRLNRAVRAGRAPNLVVALLRRLRDAGMDKHFVVIGPHALYAYEAAAGVRIVQCARSTRGSDVLWDAGKHICFVSDLTTKEASAILQILQKVDASFQLKGPHDEIAINSRGFEVGLWWCDQQHDTDRSRYFSEDENGLRPDQARCASLLTQAARVELPVIAINGSMELMNTISPSTFVKFQEWISAEKSKTSGIEHVCNKVQAELVQQMLDEGLLFDADSE